MASALEIVEQRIAALPKAEQGSRRILLERVAEVVIETPLQELVPLVDEFVEDSASVDESRSWSMAEARTRNLERVLEDQARLVKQSVRGTVVRNGMNVTRQRLHQLVSQGRLLAIQMQDGAPNLYPFWQFKSGMPVQPISDLPRLLDAAREVGMDPVELHFFMVEPNDRLGGRAPHEVLAEGEVDRVIEVLVSSGLGPF